MTKNRDLTAAHEARRLRVLAGEPVSLDPIQKALRDPTSLRAAINAKCWDCVGAGADKNPRGLIRDCGVARCSLYPVRPFQETK